MHTLPSQSSLTMTSSPQHFLERSKGPQINKSLSWWRIAATVLFIVCAVYASTVQLSGDDFWLQAKIGELIVQNHAIPKTLLFPFTEVASESFNSHEWLLSIAFHYGLTFLGEDGMPFVIGGLGLLLFFVSARLTYVRSNGNYPLALLGGYICLLAENYRHVLRPELPTMILMVTFWTVIEKFKSKPSMQLSLWAVLLMVVWANSHGSFILGPVIVGIYTAGIYAEEVIDSNFQILMPSRVVRRWIFLLVFISSSCLINPSGWELIQFVFSFSVSSEVSKHLTEWLPTFDPRLHGVRGLWIALAVWLLTAVLIILCRQNVRVIDWLFFLLFTFLAYRAIRFPVYLGIVAAYIIPACLPSAWRAKCHERHWFQVGSAIAIVTIGVIFLYGNATESRAYTLGDRTKFTAPMVKVLGDPSLQGNVLNSMEFGAELIYRAYPRLRPSIDARFDSYGTAYSLFNDALLRDDALLDEYTIRYDIRYILISTNSFEKFKELANWKSGKWRILFLDQRAVLLQRNSVH